MIPRRNLLGILIPGLTICIFAVLLALSLIRLSTIEKDMRIEATQNMLWVISRAQTASLQLQKAAALRVQGAETPDMLNRRLNNFLSHYNVLNHGPQQRQMEEMGAFGQLDIMAGEKEALKQIIPALAAGDRQGLTHVYAILGPYDDLLARTANKAMVAEWNSLGGKLENSREQVSFIIASLIVIAAAGTGMAAHLIMASRSAGARARLLEREKAFSQLLVGSSSECIIATDLEQRCTLWNEAATALFGVTAEESAQKPLINVSGFFGMERIGSALDKAIIGKTSILSDIPFFRTVAGAPVYLDLRCFPLRDGTRLIGAIMLICDVTEQYEARRQLSERRDYLEEQVLLRTQELNAALARERATTDIYRNFAAMISHQFRTPLAIVDSSLQRLKRRAADLTPDDILERCRHARAAILRLVRLVESTLDVARLDNGQIERQLQPWDLNRSISEAITLQSEETPDRRFHYEAHGPIRVNCDPVHAEHIIVNLLSNAAKYAPEGSIIHIEPILRESQAGCRIVNEGNIKAEDRPHLFERYYRGDNSREKSGVGIGLYMARSLARLQDGDVSFEALSNGRIAFSIILPKDSRADRSHGRATTSGEGPKQ
ncbi:MAG: ATP-binding protein [Sphingobium sp.]